MRFDAPVHRVLAYGNRGWGRGWTNALAQEGLFLWAWPIRKYHVFIVRVLFCRWKPNDEDMWKGEVSANDQPDHVMCIIRLGFMGQASNVDGWFQYYRFYWPHCFSFSRTERLNRSSGRCCPLRPLSLSCAVQIPNNAINKLFSC